MTTIGLAVVALMLQRSAAVQPSMVYSSAAEGQRCRFTILESDIENVPRWLETDDRPPLAPRAAIRAARDLMSMLFRNGSVWPLQGVRLRPLGGDRWVYEVEFDRPLPPQSTAGSRGGIVSVLTNPDWFRIVVLMTDRAIAPDECTPSKD
jgi:hypothetical protein